VQSITRYLNRVDLDLTGMCNRTCSFCPRSGDYPNINRHMSMETIDIVLRELRSINFTGVIELAGRGESTMHKNFKGVVEALTPADKTWQLRLTTNGYRINKWWDSLAHKFDEVILNTYTDSPEFERKKTSVQVFTKRSIGRTSFQTRWFIRRRNKQSTSTQRPCFWRELCVSVQQSRWLV